MIVVKRRDRASRVVTRALDAPIAPERAFEILRRTGAPSLLFDGRGGYEGSWPCRLAVGPKLLTRVAGPGRVVSALAEIDATIERRRAAGGPGSTGVALLLAYDSDPSLIALEVEASVTFREGRVPLATGAGDLVDRALESFSVPSERETPPTRAGAPIERPRTSLPRESYLRAASRVKDHISRGDIYQANLTQRFSTSFDRDPWLLYRALVAATPAPRSAFAEVDGISLASVSPEVFVDVDGTGRARTRPIKGTRVRGRTAAEDHARATELLASEKDRAELVMIVDLERNDLGRVARIGTVRVPELFALQSFPAVHHLVASVEAELREGIRPSELVRAVFPGGSITGAPKLRAIELLASIEPVPRGMYTGSLFWFDDDGSMASSILIRSAVVSGGTVSVGAGGGVVADSDPEAEWMEANAKARALTRVIGFEPEEAT